MYARIKGLKDDNHDHISVRLEVELLSAEIEFHGSYGRIGKRITGGGYLEGKDYVSVRRRLSPNTFDLNAARNWLETGFEEYYRKLNNM